MDMDLKIFRMNRLGLPQEWIAKRLGQTREVIRDHLADLAVLPNPPNADLSKGFTVAQVAEKHGFTQPMVWSMALDGKDDLQRFQELRWGLRTWDLWDFNDCDKRFGDEWPGRIPAQMIAHIIQAPMSAQRFSPVVVAAMQKKKILGVTSRYVIVLK